MPQVEVVFLFPSSLSLCPLKWLFLERTSAGSLAITWIRGPLFIYTVCVSMSLSIPKLCTFFVHLLFPSELHFSGVLVHPSVFTNLNYSSFCWCGAIKFFQSPSARLAARLYAWLVCVYHVGWRNVTRVNSSGFKSASTDDISLLGYVLRPWYGLCDLLLITTILPQL